MPLGASITMGATVPGGYRAPLYHLLTDAGYNVDFVGTQDSNGTEGLPDSDHEGHSGYRIDHIDGGFPAWADRVAEPDVIILLVGANDFAQNQDLKHVADRMDHLISRIVTHRPTAKLLVTDLFIRTDYPDVNEIAQTTYDPLVPGIVARHAALGQQVYFLGLNSVLTGEDLSDGLHPNQIGYNKIATNAFNLITNMITPLGTTNAPTVAQVAGLSDWNNVVITFNKPVLPESANVTNFTLSDGLKVLSARLDPKSQRDIKLETSPQKPSCSYTVTLSNVQELGGTHRSIAPNSTYSFRSAPTTGALNNVPEAADYTLVYSLDIPSRANFNATGVPYDVDNHRAVRGFSRVAYYLELQYTDRPLQFVWVSMDAFTDDAVQIGVPATGTGAFFQQYVTNMNVFSSVRNVVTGKGLGGGYLEFWPSAYGPKNVANLPHASSLLYDFCDQPTAGEYGSMQVNDVEHANTIFGFNHWANGEGKIIDLGIGNGVTGHPDWTYAANATRYSRKTLQVFVLPKGEARQPNSH